MFIDIFKQLCEKNSITPNKACIEIGLSRTAVMKWRDGGTPNSSTLAKIAEYFGVTTDYLLNGGNEKKASSKETLDLDDFTYAMYKQSGELTEAEKKQLLDMAEFLRQKRGL